MGVIGVAALVPPCDDFLNFRRVGAAGELPHPRCPVGTTVLVSSHNLRELEDVCDHVGIMDHGHVLLERSLAQLQDNMVKMQVVFPDGMEDVPAELPVLHASKLGRVHTLIMRMNAQEATERLMAYNPLLVDAVPLTLEEIFIYELGGADYAVKDIVL